MESKLFNLNGLRFSALDSGPADGALILLLHGFPQFGNAWAGVMQALTPLGYRSVALDQRGYSEGARPPGVESYEVSELTSDVLALADGLGAESFHLVGHDWGGLLAWRLAAQHPERIRSLTVLSTPHADAFTQALAHDADQQRRSQYIAWFRLPGHVAEAALLADDAALLRRVYQGKLPEAQVEENVRRLSAPGALTAALNWYRALRLDGEIGAIRVPTLYLWGDQDMALGRTAAERTGEFVEARYRFEVLEGCSHWLLEEAGDVVVRLLIDHLGTAESV